MSSWKESNILFLQNSTKVGSQIIGKMMIEVKAVFMMQDGLHLSLTIKDLLKKTKQKKQIWCRIRFEYLAICSGLYCHFPL